MAHKKKSIFTNNSSIAIPPRVCVWKIAKDNGGRWFRDLANGEWWAKNISGLL